ncbi:MAG TPA: hypothetical protein VGK59_18920 [Ohtaekwangia sp.]
MKRFSFILVLIALWSCSSDDVSPSLTGTWVDVSNENNSITFSEDGNYELVMETSHLPPMSGLTLPPFHTTSGAYTVTKDQIQLENSLLTFLNDEDVQVGVPIGSFYGYIKEGIWDDGGELVPVVPGQPRTLDDIIWKIVTLTQNKLVIELDGGKRVTYKRVV